MGYGNWDDSAYDAARTFRAARGLDDFGYTADTRSAPWDTWAAHPAMDPKDVLVRESRDSDDHGQSLPIAVLFDVTGSMGAVPRIMQEKLGKLHGLLQRKGYAEDPQILFGGIGDADCDRVPLQIGQFESDNRMDEQLRLVFLEGGGGGQKSESYELAAYFIARHTATDAWDKRGHKGYLFIVGDELNKSRLAARHVRNIIGDDVTEDISVESIYRELADRWHVHYILPNQSSYYHDPEIAEHWSGLLGERFLRLDDPAAVCELIALTIGINEDRVDLGVALTDLREIGSGTEADAVGKALAPMSATGRIRSVGALPAATTGDDDVDFGN
ncbi:hypothetical protein HLB23_17300 [Nocardia uniformis]|uniref:VWA domain-containing protein n=1 Tax=Nocardia uniformis TaxID=53432 RepID=A0A849BYH4_9NOCA|nr:hypothetical protein [Nocardia uniformis]NNH71603.1 hypothetical protein [Nocardia uniformis]